MLGKQAHATAPGRDLAEHALRLFRESEAVDHTMRRYRDGGLGRVHLSTTLTALMYELPPILRRLRTDYPGIELLVTNMPTRDTVEGILRNTIDLGLVMLPVKSSRLAITPLRPEMLVAVLSADTPDVPEEITPAYAARQPLVLEHARGAVCALVMQWLSREMPLPRPPMQIMSSGPISTGLTKPNSAIEPAICATCSAEWVRALRTYGISRSSRRYFYRKRGHHCNVRRVEGRMGVRLVVAVTDGDWFEHLRRKRDLAEVNFWAPSSATFKALDPGELFLFKLHAPRNFIVGGGVFAYANALPCSLAWEAFGEANGATSLLQMRARIARYRKAPPGDRSDFVIGCRILTQPFFLEEANWIPVPDNWSPQIVAFKGYSTDQADGLRLWRAVQSAMEAPSFAGFSEAETRYGEPALVRPRLGQGAFRVLVTDTYRRRCAVSGERTLPALDAAHIRPFAQGGVHEASNGILLRRDIHSLFDGGYVTVTPDLRFEVSRRIREEFENGRHYYALHGQTIAVPDDPRHVPDRAALRWHCDTLFRG